MCSVQMFRLYTSKLNPNFPWLWQRPKQGRLHYTDAIWYDKVKVGHDKLERFMKYLSEEAGLSQTYTNHCIRHTAMSTLDSAGFEARHIMAISGHKSENSIKKYARQCSDEKKRHMESTLTDKLLTKKPKTMPKLKAILPSKPTTSTATSTVSVNTGPLQKTDTNKQMVEATNQYNLDNYHMEMMPLLADNDNDDLLVKIVDNIENMTSDLPPVVDPGQSQNTNMSVTTMFRMFKI